MRGRPGGRAPAATRTGPRRRSWRRLRRARVRAGAGDTAECFARINRDGTPFVDSTGASSGSEPIELRPLEIAASSGGSTSSGEESYSYLHGRVGSEVGGVVIAFADGTNITASLGGGRFAAWWPGEVVATRVRGFDSAGNEVADEPY